jgi:hypothetical protein
VLELWRLADVVGLDIVSFQDYPYQASFLDTWTLLSGVAAQRRTSVSRRTSPTCRCGSRSCGRGAPRAHGSVGASPPDRYRPVRAAVEGQCEKWGDG